VSLDPHPFEAGLEFWSPKSFGKGVSWILCTFDPHGANFAFFHALSNEVVFDGDMFRPLMYFRVSRQLEC